MPYRTAKYGRSKRRRRRRFTAAALIVAVLLLSFVAVLVCAFADVAPFSTARDWMAGQSAGSGIPPGEDRPYWEYFDRQPPYSKSEFGGRIQLVNNEHATDPTWDELRDFLLADPTDLKPYTATYLCGSFAEEVHNNAEAAGIRAAWVSVDFVGETVGHALNAFRTEDRGLVYVDCTGGQPQTTVGSYDTVAYIELGKEYGRISLSAVEDFSYDSYEKYVEDWNSYDAAVDAFGSDVDAYKSLYDKCGGYYDTYAGCSRLESWYKELETLRAELDAQSARLGEWRWEPLGVVEKVEIWW